MERGLVLHKRFIVTVPKERYATFLKAWDSSIFPIMSNEKKLPSGDREVTIASRIKSIEQQLETQVFGPKGYMTKKGFKAKVVNGKSSTIFTLAIPLQCYSDFKAFWDQLGPSKETGYWSCVKASFYLTENADSYVFNVFVQNEFAADAIRVLLRAISKKFSFKSHTEFELLAA